MTISTTTSTRALSHRDRAVLRAVRAGRCLVSGRSAALLVIDGVGCCDQFVASRLVQAGLSVEDREFESPDVLLAEHEAILSAIRSGDPARAVREVRAHIETNAQRVKRIMAGRE